MRYTKNATTYDLQNSYNDIPTRELLQLRALLLKRSVQKNLIPMALPFEKIIALRLLQRDLLRPTKHRSKKVCLPKNMDGRTERGV